MIAANRIVLATVIGAMSAKAAFAQQTYATQTLDIRAGIVILDSAKVNPTDQPSSAAPHALYNLSRNTTIKPAGWNIYNPHAASTVTPGVQTRWSALDPSASLPLGMRLTKRHAAYWEVPLSSTSSTFLQDYDFLLVNPNSLLSLNTAERQKLASFVDHGGVLWVDPGALNISSGIDFSNSLPVPFALKAQSSTSEQVDYGQPIVTRPAALTRRDISFLNGYVTASASFQTSLTNVSLALQNAAGLESILGNSTSDFTRMQAFFLVGGEATATVARVGDGFVITTARGVSMKLNRTVNSGTSYAFNTRFIADDSALEADGLAAVKLAVNMLNMASEARQGGGGSGKKNSSFVDATAPLLQRSVLPSATFNSSANAQAVVYKGIAIVVDGDHLTAFDTDPQRDLDGDGDPDDGLRDLSVGGSIDVLWHSASLTTPISAPTCVEIPNPGGLPRDAVMVVDGSGKVVVFDITDFMRAGFSGSLTAKAPLTTITGPGTGTYTMTGLTPNPVTVSDGIGYIADTITSSGSAQGRLWMIDLTNPTPTNLKSNGNSWLAGGLGSGVALPDFSAASTIGYVNIADSSGGVDKVMYVPFRPTGTSGPSNPPGFVSIRLGSRGEKPVSYTASGTSLDVETRVSLPIYVSTGSDPRNARITLLDSNGNPFSGSQTAAVFSGHVTQSGGHIQFEFKPGVTELPANVAGVRVDYTIDYGDTSPGALGTIERSRIAFPNGTNDQTVLGTVALSPRGTIFVSTGNGSLGGCLWAFKDLGGLGFKCINRYQFFENHKIALQGGTLTDSGQMFEDNDGIATMIGGFIPGYASAVMKGMTLVSSPVVANDQVHVLAKSSRAGLTNAVVLTFAAEPQAPTFRVGGDFPDGTSFLQMDIARSSNANVPSSVVPDQQSIITSGSYTYDRPSGTVRFDNLMGQTTSGQIVNCLSLSQPLIVRRPGASQDTLIYPDSVLNASWTPLSWYMVMHVMVPNSTPYVTGNTLFIGGSSLTASALAGDIPPKSQGALTAINCRMSSSDTFLVTNSNRTWNKQAIQLRVNGSGIAGNPNTLWPQNNGITTFDAYRVRLNQTVLGQSKTCWGLSVGDGSLIAATDSGVFAYSRADVLVCDEGRVSRFDANGNPIWSTSGSLNLGQDDSSTIGNVTRLVRPTKATKIGVADTLVVDTGGNRLVRLNYGGVEVRSIADFLTDPYLPAPQGFVPNEPTTFSGPRDVVTYTTYETRASATAQLSATNENPPFEYWIHYVVADTGNKRLVELVDRFAYDPSTGQIGSPLTVSYNDPTLGATTLTQQSILLWHSPANVSGKNFDYLSVNRVWLPNGASGRFVYVTAIGSSLPTAADTGTGNLDGSAATLRTSSTGNGGVVIFDPATDVPTVINAVAVPAVGANVFYNESTGFFDSAAIAARTGAGGADNRMVMSGVQSVTARTHLDPSASSASIDIMVADAQGVYEFNYAPGVVSPSVSWMLPNAAYVVMRHTGLSISGNNPVQLRAVYAKRLDSGDIILVNGASGPRRRVASGLTAEGNAFNGEIIQIDGSWNSSRWSTANLGFDAKSIVFEIPPVQGIRGLVHPVFANRN